MSAAHNAQRTLHDGGAGEYGKCTAVQYNGGEKYLGKAQVLSSPFPLLLQIAKTERAKDPSFLFPVRSVSFSSDGENHEQKGKRAEQCVEGERERTYEQTDRRSLNLPLLPNRQTEKREKAWQLGGGEGRGGAEGGTDCLNTFFSFPSAGKKRGK